MSWPSAIVVDKHSVGGLPGNRTTPIIVAIDPPGTWIPLYQRPQFETETLPAL